MNVGDRAPATSGARVEEGRRRCGADCRDATPQRPGALTRARPPRLPAGASRVACSGVSFAVSARWRRRPRSFPPCLRAGGGRRSVRTVGRRSDERALTRARRPAFQRGRRALLAAECLCGLCEVASASSLFPTLLACGWGGGQVRTVVGVATRGRRAGPHTSPTAVLASSGGVARCLQRSVFAVSARWRRHPRPFPPCLRACGGRLVQWSTAEASGDGAGTRGARVRGASSGWWFSVRGRRGGPRLRWLLRPPHGGGRCSLRSPARSAHFFSPPRAASAARLARRRTSTSSDSSALMAANAA